MNIQSPKLEKVMKILTVVMVCLSFIDIFLPDAFALRFIWDFNYLKMHHNPLHAIIRAFNAMAVVTLPIAVFYKKPTFNKIVAYIMIPTVIINLLFYKTYLEYYTSDLTRYASVFGETLRPYLTNIVFRGIMFFSIMLLELCISIYVTIKNKDDLQFKSPKEEGKFIALFIGLLLTNMPIYTIQQITGGTTNITFNFGDPMHFVFIGIIIVEFIVLYLIFKNETKENKYILLLIMSISLMFQYNTFFKTDGIIYATRYPLQLCNIAGAFLITTLLKRSEKMFHFTVVVNVTGAIIAIALCDSTKNVGVLYCMNIHYMVEHINVLIVPLLCLALGVFKPLKKSDVKHFMVGFTIYYVVVWIIGTILNGIYYKTGNGYFKCNYLFMFDKDAAMRLVGSFVGKLFDIKLTLFKYYNMYLVQILVYIVFMMLCIGIFFILYLIFKQRKKKTKLNEAK